MSSSAGGAKRGLGRGLAALIPERAEAPSDAGQKGEAAERRIPLKKISLNKFQPRAEFESESLAELTESVRRHGILQPLLVRPRRGGSFELIAGERRFRAATAAGLTDVPAVVRDDISDRDALALAVIENVQREDLNPIETARAYQRLREEFGLTQAEVATEVGRSQPAVANALRLLTLPAEVQATILDGRLSEGHAKVLCSIDDGEMLARLWRETLELGLSVRALENRIKDVRATGQVIPRGIRSGLQPQLFADVEQRLMSRIGTRVKIKPGPGTRGTIEITYYDADQLEGLIERFES